MIKIEPREVAGMGLTTWLIEAGNIADSASPPQGLVFLHLDHNIMVFGYVNHVADGLLSFDVVSRITKNGPQGIDYPLQIPVHRIILARYADLSDPDLPKETWS